MRSRVVARKTHKWLGLFVGLQVVIWSLTGLYMTVVHIDIIHGDRLIREQAPRSVEAAALIDPLAAAHAAGGSGSVRLAFVRGRPAYVAAGDGGEKVVDARSGRPIVPPGESEIRQIATSIYAGREPIASVALIDDIPGEIRGRKPPLWRVEFDHWNKPTLYLSPATGELVTRRHELWRIFDFAWMLHIMDYDERENVNSLLLRGFTLSAVLLVLSGAWLLFYAFPAREKKAGGK